MRDIKDFVAQTKKDDCREMFGLVILPNRYEINKRLLPEIEKKLWMNGRKITWADVHFENYCVRVKKDERPTVTAPFARCPYCRQREHV